MVWAILLLIGNDIMFNVDACSQIQGCSGLGGADTNYANNDLTADGNRNHTWTVFELQQLWDDSSGATVQVYNDPYEYSLTAIDTTNRGIINVDANLALLRTSDFPSTYIHDILFNTTSVNLTSMVVGGAGEINIKSTGANAIPSLLFKEQLSSGSSHIGLKGHESLVDSVVITLPSGIPNVSDVLTVESVSGVGPYSVVSQWATPAVVSNFANADLTSTANRAHVFTGHTLAINNSSSTTLHSVGGVFFNSDTGSYNLTTIPATASGVRNVLVRNTTGSVQVIPDGTAGQVLSTDGAGVLSWGAAPNWANTNLTFTGNRTHTGASTNFTATGFGNYNTIATSIGLRHANTATVFVANTSGGVGNVPKLELFHLGISEGITLTTPTGFDTYSFRFPVDAGSSGDILVNVGSAVMQWQVPTTTKYVLPFSGGSWVGPSGGEYTIDISAATHGLGIDPVVQVQDTTTVQDISAGIVEVDINGSGDIQLRVTETPDDRFTGKVVII